MAYSTLVDSLLTTLPPLPLNRDRDLWGELVSRARVNRLARKRILAQLEQFNRLCYLNQSDEEKLAELRRLDNQEAESIRGIHRMVEKFFGDLPCTTRRHQVIDEIIGIAEFSSIYIMEVQRGRLHTRYA